MVRLVLALLVAMTVGGCGAATGSPWPARTPFPLPAGASPVPLATAPPASPLPPNVAWACPASQILPLRIIWDRATGTIRFIDVDTGGVVELVWPRGFSARVVADRLEIVAPDGTVVGRDDRILSGLGGTESDVCNVKGTFYPPAS